MRALGDYSTEGKVEEVSESTERWTWVYPAILVAVMCVGFVAVFH